MIRGSIFTAIGNPTAPPVHAVTLPFTRMSTRIVLGPSTVNRAGHHAQLLLPVVTKATRDGESRMALFPRNRRSVPLGSPLLWTFGRATTIGNFPAGCTAVRWCDPAAQPVAARSVNAPTTGRRGNRTMPATSS